MFDPSPSIKPTFDTTHFMATAFKHLMKDRLHMIRETVFIILFFYGNIKKDFNFVVLQCHKNKIMSFKVKKTYFFRLHESLFKF